MSSCYAVPQHPFLIRGISFHDGVVVLDAAGGQAAAVCPGCATPSVQVHDRYQRRPLDLPWRGLTVRLVLTVRRFCCENADCAKRTFAEDFAPVVPRLARRTAEAAALLLRIALAAGGEAGARLARAVGVPTSPDTLLRLIRQLPRPDTAGLRILGIDDLALRRGQTYATIFVDLETHRPIDLLPGRTANVVDAWLRAHPGVQVVSRDRAEAYPEGIRTGAPDAVQVADRFHLMRNASAALTDLLQRRRRRIDARRIVTETSPTSAASETGGPTKVLSPSRQRQVDARRRRIARWQQVCVLAAVGKSRSDIARAVGVSTRTVQRLLAAGEPPHLDELPREWEPIRSPLVAPYVAHLQTRWQQGCTNASRLYREIVGQGYTGSRTLLNTLLKPWRAPRPSRAERRWSQRLNIRWLCLRPVNQLTAEEHQALQHLLAEDEEVATGYRLYHEFSRVIRERDRASMTAWLTTAQESGLTPFVTLANGIGFDHAAVFAALEQSWSNGPVEGQIHRVKLLKRQGYGRASLDLLRCRILAR